MGCTTSTPGNWETGAGETEGGRRSTSFSTILMRQLTAKTGSQATNAEATATTTTATRTNDARNNSEEYVPPPMTPFHGVTERKRGGESGVGASSPNFPINLNASEFALSTVVVTTWNASPRLLFGLNRLRQFRQLRVENPLVVVGAGWNPERQKAQLEEWAGRYPSLRFRVVDGISLTRVIVDEMKAKAVILLLDENDEVSTTTTTTTTSVASGIPATPPTPGAIPNSSSTASFSSNSSPVMSSVRRRPNSNAGTGGENNASPSSSSAAAAAAIANTSIVPGEDVREEGSSAASSNNNTASPAVKSCLDAIPYLRRKSVVVRVVFDPYQIPQTLLKSEEEDSLFRLNRYGSLPTRRLLTIRFGNRIFEPTWNRNHVRAVLLDVCEEDLVLSEVAFSRLFCDYLMSLLALVAMERPTGDTPEDLRSSKSALLRGVLPVKRAVFARYEGAPNRALATFATLVVYIDSSRWRGVPFILRAGGRRGGVRRRQCEVRVMYRTLGLGDEPPNEIVIRIDEEGGEKALALITSSAPSFPSHHSSSPHNSNSTIHPIPNQVGGVRRFNQAKLVLGEEDPSPEATSLHSSDADSAPAPVPSAATPSVMTPSFPALTAYERVLMDSVRGNSRDFNRMDMVDVVKGVMSPILATTLSPTTTYPIFSPFGPEESDAMIREEVGGIVCPHWIGTFSTAEAASSNSTGNALLPRTSSSFFMGKGSLIPESQSNNVINSDNKGDGAGLSVIADAAAAGSSFSSSRIGIAAGSTTKAPPISPGGGARGEETEMAARWRITRDDSEFYRVQTDFALDFTAMQRLVRAFRREMRKGLESNDPTHSTIRMLPTFVTRLPSGEEEGTYYAIDLGGTNLRVCRFHLKRGEAVRMTEEVHARIPHEATVAPTPKELFGFIAENVAALTKRNAEDFAPSVGFTFSFPVEQISLNAGKLISWTKGFTTGGVEGKDVVALLEEAFQSRGVKGRVAALINDTVGTLASIAREEPEAKIGVILGTGTNACYLERISNIKKLTSISGSNSNSGRDEEKPDADDEMVINMEWGAFGSGGGRSDDGGIRRVAPLLPRTWVDERIDAESSNPNQQWFEKAISGYYLGEMVRLIVLRLHERGELWRGKTLPKIPQKNEMTSRHVSDIEGDLSPEGVAIRLIEMELFGASLSCPVGEQGSNVGSSSSSAANEDRLMLQRVCQMVAERAARLTACALAATVIQARSGARMKRRDVYGDAPGMVVEVEDDDDDDDPDEEETVVGVDGSVFENHFSFKRRLERALEALGCRVKLLLAKDGSGKGAALVAAASSF